MEDLASAVTEKFYPVHAAKVGGLAWRLLMTAGGLALVLLGFLATWSFWARRAGGTPRQRSGKALAAASAKAED